MRDEGFVAAEAGAAHINRLMYPRVEVVAEVGLALEGTAAVGAPKMYIAIVLLELRAGLDSRMAAGKYRPRSARCSRRKKNRVYARPKMWYLPSCSPSRGRRDGPGSVSDASGGHDWI